MAACRKRCLHVRRVHPGAAAFVLVACMHCAPPVRSQAATQPPACPPFLLQACQLGYTLNETTQLCEPVACKVAGCLSCQENPARCDAEGCGTSKWYDEANSACTPCSEGCDRCSQWGCGLCAWGYWMDAAARKCNKVRLGCISGLHAGCVTAGGFWESLAG